MRFDIHIHQDETEVLRLLNHIIQNQNKIMAKQDQMNELLTRLNAATNELAADLQKLRDENADKISQESLDTLDAAIKALEVMGQDAENPIPE